MLQTAYVNSDVDFDLDEADDGPIDYALGLKPVKNERLSLRAYAEQIREKRDLGYLTALSPEESRKEILQAVENAKKLKERAQAKVKQYSL